MYFSESKEFQKEFKKLSKRFRTLAEDLEVVKKIITVTPRGNGAKHWVALKSDIADERYIMKMRMMCRAVRGAQFRLVYLYSEIENITEILFIEIYFKGDKEREDLTRVDEYFLNKIMTHQEIIKFWFEETAPEQRFIKDLAFDELIRSRFGEVYEKAVARDEMFIEWRRSAEGALAEVILLDQFSRNLFRGEGEAFAQDEYALELARCMIARGQDVELPLEKRQFAYMPFMHSESVAAHEEALKLFEIIGGESLKYEIEHKNIIDKFGRYPHRNQALGRESTPEEIEFLKTHEGF